MAKKKRNRKTRSEQDVQLVLDDGWKQEDLDGLDDSTFELVVATIKRAAAADDDAQDSDEDHDDDSGDDDAQDSDEDHDDDSGDDDAQDSDKSGGPRLRGGSRRLSAEDRVLRETADDFGQEIPAGTF